MRRLLKIWPQYNVTKLKCISDEYITLKITTISGIYKSMYRSGSYLLLFEKGKLLSFEISYEKFLWFWNKRLSFFKRCTLSFEIK